MPLRVFEELATPHVLLVQWYENVNSEIFPREETAAEASCPFGTALVALASVLSQSSQLHRCLDANVAVVQGVVANLGIVQMISIL